MRPGLYFFALILASTIALGSSLVAAADIGSDATISTANTNTQQNFTANDVTLTINADTTGRTNNGISVDGVVGTETWMALYAITPGGGTGFNYPVVTGSGNGSEIDWHTIKTWGLIAVSAVLGVGVLTNSTSKSNSKKKRK